MWFCRHKEAVKYDDCIYNYARKLKNVTKIYRCSKKKINAHIYILNSI